MYLLWTVVILLVTCLLYDKDFYHKAANQFLQGIVIEGFITTVKIIQDISKGHDAKQTEKILAALNVAINEDNNSLSSINKHLHELTFLANELSLYQAEIEIELKKWTTKLSRK